MCFLTFLYFYIVVSWQTREEETVAFMNDLITDKAIVVGGVLAVSVKKAYIQSVDEQSIA